jgi:peptidoglycan/LPS O-acetylase OafA/YrhL
MQGSMPHHLSLYLDLVRFAAALVVVLSHAWLVLFPGYPLHWPGPAAVIAFFVLSGFVIAYVTDTKRSTLADYTLDRLSRLWSVALPALGFGLVLGQFADRSVFMPELGNASAVLHTAENAVFLAQTWFLDLAPPLNGPFWSLNYEAWFYAIFGAWIYLSRSSRAWVAGVLAIIAGPKILLLMPCWLLGVLLYRTLGRWRWSERTSVLLWACSLLAAALLVKSTIPTRLHDAFQTHAPVAASLLAYSGYPLTDYLLAVLMAVNFRAAAYAGRLGRILLPVARPIRQTASFTLTIYLFHLPLLILFWDLLHMPPAICLLALSGSIIGIGYLTEYRRRDLRALLAFIAAGLRRRAIAWSAALARVKHSTPPTPIGLGEADPLETEIAQHRLDTATVRGPPVGRVAP